MNPTSPGNGAPTRSALSFRAVSLQDMVLSQEAGRRALDELLLFLKHKIEAEDRASSDLAKSCKVPLGGTSPPANSSLNLALQSLRAYAVQRRTDQGNFAVAFETQVRRPLVSAQASLRAEASDLKLDVAKATKSVAASDGMQKKAWVAAHEALALSASSQGRSPSSSRLVALETLAQAAKRELLQSLSLRDRALDEVANRAQRIETARASATRRGLERFANLERQNLKERAKALASLEAAIARVDTAADLNLVVKHLQAHPSSSNNGVSSGSSCDTLARGYSRAITLLEWDYKRQADKREAEAKEAALASDANVRVRSPSDIDSYDLRPSSLERPPTSVEGCVNQLVKPRLRSNDNGMETVDASAAESASAWLASACESETSRSSLIQAMNEARVGEVAVPHETFDALCRVFVAALTCCDAQRDVKNARQFMIMSETYKRQQPINNSAGSSSVTSTTGAQSPSSPTAQGTTTGSTSVNGGAASDAPSELYVAQSRAVAGHVLWSRRWFWEELMLFGVAGQFELCPQSAPWNTLQPDQLHDEVCRVHATVFSELGAVISNMVRFGCPEDDIRAFLDHMCARSQLTDEQAVQLHAILDRELWAGSWVTTDTTTTTSGNSPTTTLATRENVVSDASAQRDEYRDFASTSGTGQRNPLQTVAEGIESPEKADSGAGKANGEIAESIEALRRELNNSLRAKEELERNFKEQTAELALLKSQRVAPPSPEMSAATES